MATNAPEPARVAALRLKADGMTVAAIARELSIPRSTLRRWFAKPAAVEAIEQEREARQNVATGHRTAHYTRVMDKAAGAACGEWDPTENQMRLIAYFIGWIAPSDEPQDANLPATNPTQVNVVIGADWRPPTPTVIEST